MCPLLITFATKLYLPGETYISYSFMQGTNKKGILEGFFVCA